MNVLMSLLRSRKFWVSLVGLVAIVLMKTFGIEIPEEQIVAAIVAIVIAFNGSTAFEDGMAKRNGNF